MGDSLNGRVLVLIICVFTSLCIEDPAHFLVTAAHNHSGSDGRTQHLPNLRKKLSERRSPSENQQNLELLPAYKNNTELLGTIREYSTRCGHISRLYTIGKSVKGVPLMVLEISDFPGQFEPEPAFKYVGNMHGDEPSGRELTLCLAEWLCANYLKDPLATLIVQNVHLHLLPSMNPDGFERRTRNNANDIDLNRDFPDQFYSLNNNEFKRQPETSAIMQWILKTQFTASASLHEGALVASYGWDGTLSGRTGYAESPDDGGFRYMASLYAQFNPSMKKNPEFVGGVTNGAAWYPLYGGMQDWNYIYGNCFEITLEMNDGKWPDVTKMIIMVVNNPWVSAAMAADSRIMESASAKHARACGKFGKGVHGRVISSADGRPLPAQITVKGNGHPINASSTFGDYHRILPPGKIYELTAKLPGYVSRTTTIVLSYNKATTLDFVLDPVPTSEVCLQALPKPQGFRRTPISSDAVDWAKQDALAVPCAEVGVAKPLLGPHKQGLGRWIPRKHLRSWDHGDKLSEVTMEQLGMISAWATVILMAVVLFILVRWRRSRRPQPIRHLVRNV